MTNGREGPSTVGTFLSLEIIVDTFFMENLGHLWKKTKKMFLKLLKQD